MFVDLAGVSIVVPYNRVLPVLHASWAFLLTIAWSAYDIIYRLAKSGEHVPKVFAVKESTGTTNIWAHMKQIVSRRSPLAWSVICPPVVIVWGISKTI